MRDGQEDREDLGRASEGEVASRVTSGGEVGRTVSESRTVRSELVFPNDANPTGNIFGGRVLMLMDVVAAIAARRHSRREVVTAEIDSVHFLRPIRVGECIEAIAEVSAVGHTSMEIEVRIVVEDLFTGAQAEAASAYLTYVALDAVGRPTASRAT